ncbi:MAG: metallophosphoesterase [Vicinamibacterales bacterium]
MPRLVGVLFALLIATGPVVSPATSQLASGPTGSLKLAVIGDNGTGEPPQYDIGRQMAAARGRFPFEAVLMLGDNMYGSQRPQDFIVKFERPYAALLAAGVTFHATLGNHDRPENRHYAPFNMGGQRYYTWTRRGVRFVVLDTNIMEATQVKWAAATLQAATEPWKICYFHHPLYSDAGRHGSNVDLRVLMEPLLVAGGVQVVLSGHEHVYERLKPQKGITYFVAGSSGQLRKGDLPPAAPDMAAGFDQDRAFMLVEITGTAFSFEVISRTGNTVDSGVIRRAGTT